MPVYWLAGVERQTPAKAGAIRSRCCFEVLDLGDALPQFLLDDHDDGHHRRRAAGAGPIKAHPSHAALDLQHLDGGAVQFQRGGNLAAQYLLDACFQGFRHRARPPSPRPSPPEAGGEGVRSCRAFSTSRRNCALNSSTEPKRLVSRKRAKKSIAIVRPYGSPAKSIRCTSILRACSPNVGFGPILAAAGSALPSTHPRTA